MTFKMSLLMTADADDARAEVKGLGQEVKNTEEAVEALGKTSKKTQTSTKGFGDTAGGAAKDVDGLTAAQRRAAAEAQRLRGANDLAAGSVANLTAQFNDIGVMVAAGQNPLQLALQQGTQISQVLGPMGAGKAVRSLGAALMSMVSPLSLITIGSIAAGSALFNWFRSASGQAESFADHMGRLEEEIGAYQEAVDRAGTPTDELRKKFGAAADEVARLYRELAQGQREGAGDAATRGLRAFLDESNLDLPRYDFGDQQRLARGLDLSLFGAAKQENRRLVNAILQDYVALSAAAEGSISDQVSALAALYGSFRTAAKASGEISAAEQERLTTIANLIEQLQKLRETDASFEEQETRAARTRHAAMMRYYADSRVESDAARDRAHELLADLNQEIALKAAVNAHGADSAEVAQLRVDAERAAFEETLSTLNVSEDLKDQLRLAFDAANDFAGVDLDDPVNSAAQAAASLAERLGISLELARKIVGTTGALGAPDGDPTILGFEDGDPRSGKKGVWSGGYSRTWQGRPKPDKAAARQVANQAKRERKAVTDLIQSYQDELAILREADPVKQAMIRHRHALKAATSAERAEVEELIRTSQREEAAKAAAQEATQEFRAVASEALTGLLFEGQSLADTFDNVAKAIAKAAFEAAVLEPILASLGLGTTKDQNSGGNFLGNILGAIFGGGLPAKSGGGMIYGPGSGTSDDVLMWGSNGEFVVTAEATQRYRPWLEAINAGVPIPGYAHGGMISKGGAGSAPPPLLGMAPSIQIINNSSAPVTGQVEETAPQSGRRNFRVTLADQVGDALVLQGGGGQKALRNYGVQPQLVQR